MLGSMLEKADMEVSCAVPEQLPEGGDSVNLDHHHPVHKLLSFKLIDQYVIKVLWITIKVAYKNYNCECNL
jgi:hypothetical protein